MAWIVELGGGGRGLAAVCLAAAVLVAGSCSSGSTPESGATPATGPATLRGYIDFPKPGQTVTGKFFSFGWAVSEDGIKRVSGTVDRKFPMECTYGTSRPDVNKVVRGFPSGDNPGWNCIADATTLPAGNHEITVESESNKGQIRNLGSVPVVIAH
ncbi:MAG: hypothetical protein P4L56_21495 [Candidatus Sulfopaludibacter sp.]|nr:hypothetical protein [Candidatus Sulfopaludibacter sp.]